MSQDHEGLDARPDSPLTEDWFREFPGLICFTKPVREKHP